MTLTLKHHETQARRHYALAREEMDRAAASAGEDRRLALANATLWQALAAADFEAIRAIRFGTNVEF